MKRWTSRLTRRAMSSGDCCCLLAEASRGMWKCESELSTLLPRSCAIASTRRGRMRKLEWRRGTRRMEREGWTAESLSESEGGSLTAGRMTLNQMGR